MTPETRHPLTSWICDTCGEPIARVEDGYVEWRQDASSQQPGIAFRLVHHASASPRRWHDRVRGPGEGCYAHGRMPDRNDLALADFLGPNGIARLLAILEAGVADMAGFLDLFRRVQMPWYEEARRRWPVAERSGLLSEYGDYAYFPDTLRSIAALPADDEG